MVKLFAKRVLIRGARVNFYFNISEAAFRRGRSLSRRFDPERTNERERGGWGKCDQFKQMKRKNLFFDLKILTIAILRFLWAVLKWRGEWGYFVIVELPHLIL